MSPKVYALSREQVREICPSCAEKMQLARIKILKLSADELGNLLPDDETTIKLFAGFSQGLCNKFDAESKGFFTRCAETMSGKVEDEKGFCASLEKYCTGKWPAEKKDHAVANLKSMTRQQVAAKCSDCAGKMAGNEQDMPVDAGGHMQHICGKGGRAIAHYAEALEVHEHANAIKGIQIFRTGVHNGDTYTEKDLDDMVSAFGVLDYRPALKLGHTKDTPGAPAYGWVQNLHRDGDKLIADFEDMHDSVVDAIRTRSYPNVSSEIYFNLKRGGKDYRRALKAVALLGAEVPAVAGLTPLHKMEFAAEGFDKIGLLEQTLEVPSQALVDTLAERVAGLVNIMKEYDMAKNTQKIEELKGKVEELNEQIVALNAAGDGDAVARKDMLAMMKKENPDATDEELSDMVDEGMEAQKEKKVKLVDTVAKKTAIKELSEQATALEEEIHTLEIEEDNTGAISALSKELSESKAREEAARKETKELAQRVERIEHERRAAELGTKVEACKIPAFRNSLKAVYTYALAHADAVVKMYSKDKEGKETATDKSLVEAIDGVVSEINAQSEKLFKALAFSGQTVRPDGTSDADAGVELQKRVSEYRAKHPEVKQYEQAMTAVLKADDELAQRYRNQLGQEQ